MGLALLSAGLCLGCAGAEEEVIERYFAASQRGDNETVAMLSMVTFPEAFDSFNLLELRRERRQPFDVPRLRGVVESIKDERDVQFRVFGDFRRDNYESLRGIAERLEAEPDYHFPGQLGELQDQWELFRLERRQVVTKLHEANKALEQEIRRVRKSLQRESKPSTLTGEVVSKDARVRISNSTGDSHYRITLSRYELKNQFDAVLRARWIVTAVATDD